MEAEDEHCFILPKVYMLKINIEIKQKYKKKKTCMVWSLGFRWIKTSSMLENVCYFFTTSHEKSSENGI